MEQHDRQFRELFQELKQDDARHTPSFARVWAGATARGENNAEHWRAWPVMVAALALLVCAGAWFAFFRRAPIERIALPLSPPPYVAPAPPSLPMVAASNDKQGRRARPRHHKPAPLLPLETLISQWRSPTDFLLKTPALRSVKEVPRFELPRVAIKPLVIGRKNNLEEL